MLLAVLDQNEPGTAEAYTLLRAAMAADPARVAALVDRYNQEIDRIVDEASRLGVITANRAADARALVKSWATARQAIGVVEGLPIVGQIVKGALPFIDMLVGAAAEAARQGRSVFQPTISVGYEPFSGWKEGLYWMDDYPVFSFIARVQANRLGAREPGSFAHWSQVADLAAKMPYGPDGIAQVKPYGRGQYEIRYNIKSRGRALADIAQVNQNADYVDGNVIRRVVNGVEGVAIGADEVPKERNSRKFDPWRGTLLEPYIPREFGGAGQVLPSDLSDTPLENIHKCISPEAKALFPAFTTYGRVGVPAPCEKG